MGTVSAKAPYILIVFLFCILQGIAPYIGLNFAVYESLKGMV